MRGKKQPQDIEIKLLVKVIFRHGFQRSKLKNTRVVDQNIQSPERRFGRVQIGWSISRFLRHIRLHRNRPAARLGNLCYHVDRGPFFTGRIIHHHGGPFGRQMFGDGVRQSL